MLRAARRVASSFRLSPFCILFLLLAAGSLFGEKSASFSARRDYLAADGASTPAVADLNGDGILDVVLPDKTNNPAFTTDVSVLLGKADGTFGPPQFFNTGGLVPEAVVIADFNADGKKDLAVTTENGVSILLGDGHGNFGAPRIFPAGTTPAGIVAADFNGDHRTDIAVASGQGVAVLLNSTPAGNAKVARTSKK